MDIMPSQDAIAEFNMLTSNYPPDYGISSGATMSLSLKSGTQKFHGTLFEFNRTPAYDAKEPISGTKTNIHYNIFGGNIGGPLFIPHVYNSDRQKTFFFWNEEWRKILSGAGTSNNPTIPDADRPTLGTDLHYVVPKFSASDSDIITKGLVVPDVGDPAFNQKLAALNLTPGGTFPGNVIPAALFDPNAVAYMNTGIIPKPTTSDDKAIANVANPINVRDDVLRIDHKINDKWAILGHYMHDTVNQGYALPFLGWLWASYNTVTSNLSNPSNSAAIKMTGQINPNLVIEASINYDGNVINITNSSLANKPSGWSVQPYFDNGSKLIPGMSWGSPYNVAEQQGSAPWHNAAQDYEPKGDLSYTMGKHQMKFGFSYNRYTKNQQLFGQVMGQLDFGAGKSHDSMVDMLLGIASNYNQFASAPIRHYVNQTPSAYAMDNWHVTPRLSLQLGLRYDALPHAWERQNYVSNFDPGLYVNSQRPEFNLDGSMNPAGPGFQTVNGTAFYLNGIGLAGVNGFPTGLVTNDYKTLQPRVGFSEDLFGNGKTVLRGGFGTFFERMQGNDIYNAATTPPFAYSPSAGNVYLSTPSKSWVTGAEASVPTFPSGITNLAKTYKAPAVAQFSLGVQRELSPSLVWVVQYVGNLAWHQNIQRHVNNYPIDLDMGARCDSGDGGNNYQIPGAGTYTPADGSTSGKALDIHDVCPGTSVSGVFAPTFGDGTNKTYPGQPQNLKVGSVFRQFQGWGDINQQENTTNGNYNGFQTGLRVQNRWGLSGEIDYTWSHEIDLTTYDLAGVSNPWNLKYDKGSGALDRRHILSANYVYKLPIFTQSTGLAHSILGGWELAGTVIDEKGVIPANQGPGLSISYDSIGLGGGYTNRPNVNGKVKYMNKRNQWFDTSQFSNPVPVWLGGPNQGFGNAGKDAIVGPSRVNFTTSLYKSFAMTERAHVELRFESFNTFNHFQPNGLNISKGASQFGQITSAWDPRTMELGGKFIF